MSQTQDDGVEEPPPCVRDRPAYLGPDPLTAKRMQAEAKEKEGIDLSSSSEEESDSDDDSKVVQVPDLKSKPSSSNWLQRITKRELAKKQLKETIEKQEKARARKHKKFTVGAYVYTRDKRIAPKSKSPKPGGKRCYRLKCFGTVMKESVFYDDVWIVKFDDGRTFACSEALLIVYIPTTSPSHLLTKDANNELTTKKIDKSYEDRDLILATILNSKIHKTEGHEEVTYETLLSLFKPQYAWLTASKLRKYVSMSRRSCTINTPSSSIASGTWMHELPTVDDHEYQSHPNKTSSPSTNKTDPSKVDDSKEKKIKLTQRLLSLILSLVSQ